MVRFHTPNEVTLFRAETFFTKEPETLAWIAAADLLVSASRDEGAPTVVREARLLGTPVLAARAGDVERWAAQDPGITLL